MNIKEFIKTAKDGELSVSELIKAKRYIPSSEKTRLANDAIDLSVEYDRGFMGFDSYKKYLAFIFAIIEAHTNLRFADNWDDKIHEYDELCENELFDMIIDTFRKDYDESFLVLDMMCNDMLANNSVEASIARLATSASENLDVFVGALSDKLDNIDIEKIIPKDLDLNKLQRMLNKFK